MSSKSDHPDGPSTLPEPELNPLLNPVLGQHMGRWAEVYFTSPPEKRDQAVLELLHELQGENAGNPVPSTISARKETSEPVFESVSEIPKVSPAKVRCHACGRENPPSHRFCGMCGLPVRHQAVDPADMIGDPRPEERTPHERHDETAFPRQDDTVYEPALSSNELSLFQERREHGHRVGQEDEIFSYSRAPRSYRAYVGIALALVIFALGYLGWRSAQATSQSPHVELQAAPAVTPPATPAPVPSSTSKTDTSDATSPVDALAVAPSQPVHSDPVHTKKDANPGRDESVHAKPPTAPVADTRPSETSLAGNGAEELAIAQRYLTGGNGLQRNSSEAAKWLWKSLSKHNADATLLLADLYLKGDGVSKNCDQARVLLDSAGRAGVKQAGERLRHLQAFGCE